MKKVAFQILFDVEDDTTEKDLKDGLLVALDHGFEFGDNETCKISLIENFVEPPPTLKATMSNQLSVLDLMRLRYMKGESLLQAGDSFDFQEGIEAMGIVNQEAKARGMESPVAVRQPT